MIVKWDLGFYLWGYVPKNSDFMITRTQILSLKYPPQSQNTIPVNNRESLYFEPWNRWITKPSFMTFLTIRFYDHLSTTNTISGFHFLPLNYNATFKQRPPVNNSCKFSVSKGRFHQRPTSSFCTCRSQKRKKTLVAWLSFFAFGICMCKSVGGIDPRSVIVHRYVRTYFLMLTIFNRKHFSIDHQRSDKWDISHDTSETIVQKSVIQQ